MSLFSFRSSFDASLRTLVLSIRKSIPKILSSGVAKTSGSSIQRRSPRPLMRSPHQWLPLLSLLALAAATSTVLPQQMDQLSTPREATADTFTEPPRAQWPKHQNT